MEVHFGETGTMKSGTMSMIYWENPDIEQAMNLLFRVKPYEKIEAIAISNKGIKAKFTYIEASQSVKDLYTDNLLVKSLTEEIIDYAQAVHDGLKNQKNDTGTI